MTQIRKLLLDLCPNGVPYLTLREVAAIGTGSSNRNESTSEGIYPFYVRSKEIRRIDSYEFDETAIVIPGEGGVGDIFHYVEGKYALHQRAYRIAFHDDKVLPKFAYYYLKVDFKVFIKAKAVDGTVTSIRKPMIEDFRIPVPPLAIQQEIVEILDTFTELEVELEAELEARKVQYENLSRTMFDFNEGEAEKVKVSDICRITRGTVISKDYLRAHPGKFPVYSSQTLNNGIFGYIDTFAYDFESLTWTTDGANAGSIFFHENEQFTITNVCGLLQVIDEKHVLTRYLYYVLTTEAPKYVSAGMGNPKLMAGTMGDIELDIPPVDKQREIVTMLDKFDALIHGLSEGLPGEIDARRKQHEHYRTRLLSFKELELA